MLAQLTPCRATSNYAGESNICLGTYNSLFPLRFSLSFSIDCSWPCLVHHECYSFWHQYLSYFSCNVACNTGQIALCFCLSKFLTTLTLHRARSLKQLAQVICILRAFHPSLILFHQVRAPSVQRMGNSVAVYHIMYRIYLEF